MFNYKNSSTIALSIIAFHRISVELQLQLLSNLIGLIYN